MFSKWKQKKLIYFTLFLLAFTFFVISLDWRASHRAFSFVMLDVGQGDALFLESPDGVQMLFDAGSPGRVLKELRKFMFAFDDTLDAIVITNPDQDHIGGFTEVLKNYKVGVVFEPGTYNPSNTYLNLKKEIREKKIPLLLARAPMRLHLGGGAVVDILFPDRDVSSWERNDGSIVARLTYGETSIMLMGDATTKTEKAILAGNAVANFHSDVLKVGHHGSATSTSEAFVRALRPKYALISSGKDNKYDHPHEVVLGTLQSFGIEILRTDTLGNIVLKSDGKKEIFSFHR